MYITKYGAKADPMDCIGGSHKTLGMVQTVERCQVLTVLLHDLAVGACRTDVVALFR